LSSAAAYPDSPALAVRGVVRTYAELEHKARVWANAVIEMLGRPAIRVGVEASQQAMGC